MLFIGKGTLAATVAWVIAYNVMAAQSPAFAPFSAILMLQVTIYQSIVQSLRFLGAVIAGVALQGLIVLLVGPELLAFALVALIALGLSRIPHLGAQRYQVSTAAFFAFSTYVAATDQIQGYLQLGQIILLVIVGCIAGVVVNLVVFPPLRYRSAEYGVRAVGNELGMLFEDMSPTVRDAKFDADQADQWHLRAVRLGTPLSQARASTQTAWESAFYNPRRIFERSRVSSFEGYSALINALERFSRQVTAIADDMRNISGTAETEREDAEADNEGSEKERSESPGSAFLYAYGRYLGAVGEALRILGELDEDRLGEQQSQMLEWLEEARGRYAHLGGEEATNDEASEVLLVDAKRLLEELRATSDAFGACAGSDRGE